MTTVALFIHSERSLARTVSDEITDWLTARDHHVVAFPAREDDDATDDHDEIDLVIAIGGDGTMLRAAARGVAAGADILGINVGRLGYLAEVEADGWERALETYFAGRHAIAERLMVAATLAPRDGEAIELPPALNEVVVEKQAMGRTVHLGVSIDGEFFHSYIADGVILATPTGSTAYSLSARGPIIAPTHRAFLLTAVSPHSLFDRSLVLEPSSTVAIEVLGDRDAGVAVDGSHLHVMGAGDRVLVTAAATAARFVTFGEQDFHRILKSKFGLSDR